MGYNDTSWAICKQSAPRFRQITTPTSHHSFFTGRMLFPTTNQQTLNTHTKVNERHKYVFSALTVGGWAAGRASGL